MISILLCLTLVVRSTGAFTTRPTTACPARKSSIVLCAEDGGPSSSTLTDGGLVPFVPTGVTLKMAFDSKGGVADLSIVGSGRFTCAESLDMVHRLRRVSDAVLVGRSTVEMDDCTLTVRRVSPIIRADGGTVQPVRVVLDPHLGMKVDKYQIASDGLSTIVVHVMDIGTGKGQFSKTKSKDFPNVTYLGLPQDPNGRLSPRLLCTTLSKEFDIQHVMVEGGPTTARQFLDQKMVDRAILVRAPVSFKEPLPSNLTESSFEEAGLKLLGTSMCGVDMIEYYSRPGLPWPEGRLSSWP
jgi:riboflavin biosynthesis pyrimidine reductase